jgi:hypothetical protein
VASRDSEVRQVTARLESLLDALAVNVAALTAILIPPVPGPPAPDAKEPAQ